MEQKFDQAIEVVKAKIPALTVHSDWQKAAQAVLNLETAKATYNSLGKTDESDDTLEFVLGRVRSSLGATELQQVTQAVMHLMQAKAQIQPAKTSKAKTN